MKIVLPIPTPDIGPIQIHPPQDWNGKLTIECVCEAGILTPFLPEEERTRFSSIRFSVLPIVKPRWLVEFLP